MNLAQQSLALNNFGRAQELLNRHRPATKTEIDLRGWEWRYLWQFCQGDDLFTLCRQTNSAFSLAASRDGRWLAVGEFAERRGFRVGFAHSPGNCPPVHRRRGASSARVAFSPQEPLLAFSTATPEGSTVRLWNAATRSPVATLPLDGRVHRPDIFRRRAQPGHLHRHVRVLRSHSGAFRMDRNSATFPMDDLAMWRGSSTVFHQPATCVWRPMP